MKRLFWVALGATAGVLIVRRVTKVAEQFTPSGMGQSLDAAVTKVADAVADFVDDLRVNMAEREAELRESLGITAAEVAETEANQRADEYARRH